MGTRLPIRCLILRRGAARGLRVGDSFRVGESLVYRRLTTSTLLLASTFLVAGRALSQDRFFKEDFYTGALYLKFSADGVYEFVDREHMGVWVADRGRWHREDDKTFVFVSEKHIDEIVTEVGSVTISGEDGKTLLPSLRSKLSSLLEGRSESGGLRSAHVASVEVTDGNGSVRVELAQDVVGGGTVSSMEVQSLLNEIDRYLLSQLRHVTRRRIDTHRGITFIVSLAKGVHAPVLDADEIRQRIEELGGRVPAYVLAEISEDVFRQELQTTYPFRFIRPK